MQPERLKPGGIVACRNRQWVLLPSDRDDVWALRPLAGTDDDVVLIHKHLAQLVGYDFPYERPQSASFPLPKSEEIEQAAVRDAASVRLLWQAARLILREGATPFRSLGRISIRPRQYQFVPLLMALRLDPVRLFIADDVGVGKTIEALLIARELLDRGEIRRFCVLSPPYLCEQWAKEIREKFNLDPVVVRSGTIGSLERQVPPGKTVYDHFPVQVASIDFVKTDRNRHAFLQFCPELVIVDEAHGAAAAQGTSQQERHGLLRQLAKDEKRHLVLLTATPHSGIEDAFRSLLGLLHPDFAAWNLAALDEEQRIALARHFVQRTRRDIEQEWERASCFPKREPVDEAYALSDRYRELFERTYEFCSEIVRTGERLEERKRRVRYWGALALLRCVMSSPAAAVAALSKRSGGPSGDDEEPEFHPFVFESTEDRSDDEAPTPPLEAAAETLPDADRRRLRELTRLAERLQGPEQDTKLACAIRIVRDLMQEGFHPILWCRYVATAEYVADHLRKTLLGEVQDVQVVCLTGRTGDDERQARIEEIDSKRPRVLVATDCLSEGINLQEKFTAVVHYDLPWNPNRLEQREGRVDRYGQPAETVKVVRFFGRDNPVDGAVIDVLLKKAREIHRTLGTHVPVPEDGERVMEAVLKALFLRGGRGSGRQLVLDLGLPEVGELHRRWERDAERERINRTRFAQRALKTEEVQRELEATDAVLGDPAAVREFVLTAAERLGLSLQPDRRPGVFRVAVSGAATAALPETIRLALPAVRSDWWVVSFDSPTPEGAEYLGRNHPFVATLARFLFEEALGDQRSARASRFGALRTPAVAELTTLFLLRVRYLIEQPEKVPMLAEEVLVLAGREKERGQLGWLEDGEALRLLAEAKAEGNIPPPEKQELIRGALDMWPRLADDLEGRVRRRAETLAESHKRIRRVAGLRVRELDVKPQLPTDLLGILVLQPMVRP
ncbi:RNA polymerase-associated protein RapA [bacterium HR40]|nr:RNA polymerase-associated protein RapA [bacterium HR40]